jgi:hypothetical protein
MTNQNKGNSRKILWSGYILSALPVLVFVASAAAKLMKPAQVVQGFAHFGYSESSIIPLGIIEIACTVIYLIPRTACLGAILLTGYLGGAVATTARLGEPYIMAIGVGVLVWGGLWLRDPRLRELIPFLVTPRK